MKQYSHDYTLVQEAMDSLYSATRLHANGCYHDALGRINEARTILTRYLSQDNMVPDDDVSDGWVRASEAEAEMGRLKKQHGEEYQPEEVLAKIAHEAEQIKRLNNKIKAKVVKRKKIDSSYLERKTEGADPTNPLYEKIVVESGTYEQIGLTRDDVAAAIQKLGAKLNRDVSKKMTAFVTGNNFGPAKMEKVMQWRAEGLDIDIIDQIRFKEIVDKYLGKQE